MNEYANPLDYILNCTEQGVVPKLFTIQNAKDELQELRNELSSLKASFSSPQAWARLNDRGDIYNPSVVYNPYLDQNTVLPLYCNMDEFKTLIGQLKNS